jgi:hypothetical protein
MERSDMEWPNLERPKLEWTKLERYVAWTELEELERQMELVEWSQVVFSQD